MISSFAPAVAGRKATPASAYKLPLGDVECDCWSCGRPVHTSELTFTFAEGAIRWIHRGCRSRRSRDDTE